MEKNVTDILNWVFCCLFHTTLESLIQCENKKMLYDHQCNYCSYTKGKRSEQLQVIVQPLTNSKTNIVKKAKKRPV